VIRRPHQVALVKCTDEYLSRATDIAARSVHLTAQATWRLLAARSTALGAAPGWPGGRAQWMQAPMCGPREMHLRVRFQGHGHVEPLPGPHSSSHPAPPAVKSVPSERPLAPWRPRGGGVQRTHTEKNWTFGASIEGHPRPRGSAILHENRSLGGRLTAMPLN